MLKFLSLSSGSCGNCYFLSDGRSGLLIDGGQPAVPEEDVDGARL